MQENLSERIRDLSKIFAFQAMTQTIMIEERLTSIICMSIAKQRSNADKLLDHFERVGIDNKIDLTKAILECNYPEILKKYPKIFSQIAEIKTWRNKLAHLNRYYEVDPQGDVKFVLHHRKISKQERLTADKMQKIITKADKCNSDVTEIENLIARETGFRT